MSEAAVSHSWGTLQAYFGRTVGSPPGLPGGGMTGVLLPASGVGARMSGSTFGGQITPSVRASLSLRLSPVVAGGAVGFCAPGLEPVARRAGLGIDRRRRQLLRIERSHARAEQRQRQRECRAAVS